jgi:phage pi2 protein 07
MSGIQVYQGFRIERFEGASVRTVHNKIRHTLRSVCKKEKGYQVFYPDSDGSKVFSTLREAKQYIDSYMGEE